MKNKKPVKSFKRPGPKKTKVLLKGGPYDGYPLLLSGNGDTLTFAVTQKPLVIGGSGVNASVQNFYGHYKNGVWESLL